MLSHLAPVHFPGLRSPTPTILFPYTTLFRSPGALVQIRDRRGVTVTLRSGTTQLGSGEPMIGGDGRFRVGSITKIVTAVAVDRKSTRLNSSHLVISYAAFCLKTTEQLLCTQT